MNESVERENSTGQACVLQLVPQQIVSGDDHTLVYCATDKIEGVGIKVGGGPVRVHHEALMIV